MVCLKHVSELCKKCPPSVFVLNYHYSIEELCSLEQSLADRLAHFYAWRNQLSVIIKPSDSNTFSSNHFMKQEANDNHVVVSNNSTSGTMTLEELEVINNAIRLVFCSYVFCTKCIQIIWNIT